MDRRVLFRMILVLAMLAEWTCAGHRFGDSAGAMLLDRMNRLARESALTVDLIRDALEVMFAKDEMASSEMVAFFIGTPRPGSRFESLIKRVDCRVPSPQNTAMQDLFVLVELQQTVSEHSEGASGVAKGLLRSDVVAKFGQPDSFQPQPPEDPESWGICIYKVGSRSLWFSLRRQAADEVLDISIHPLSDVRLPVAPTR